MIGTYFTQLEQLLQQFPTIQSYTLTKKVYNIKQGFINGSILFENGEGKKLLMESKSPSSLSAGCRYIYAQIFK